MANSKGRRKLRRLAKEVLPLLREQIPAEPPPLSQKPTPWLRRVPKWFYGALVFVSLCATLSSLYPWITIEQGSSLKPTDPFQTLFYGENEGILPLTNVSVTCVVNATSNAQHAIVRGLPVSFIDGPRIVWYRHKFSLPCHRVLGGISVYDSASLSITVHYGVAYMPIHLPQTFTVRGEKGENQEWHWLFTG